MINISISKTASNHFLPLAIISSDQDLNDLSPEKLNFDMKSNNKISIPQTFTLSNSHTNQNNSHQQINSTMSHTLQPHRSHEHSQNHDNHNPHTATGHTTDLFSTQRNDNLITKQVVQHRSNRRELRDGVRPTNHQLDTSPQILHRNTIQTNLSKTFNQQNSHISNKNHIIVSAASKSNDVNNNKTSTTTNQLIHNLHITNKNLPICVLCQQQIYLTNKKETHPASLLCGHIFHFNCINEKSLATGEFIDCCPVCQRSICDNGSIEALKFEDLDLEKLPNTHQEQKPDNEIQTDVFDGTVASESSVINLENLNLHNDSGNPYYASTHFGDTSARMNLHHHGDVVNNPTIHHHHYSFRDMHHQFHSNQHNQYHYYATQETPPSNPNFIHTQDFVFGSIKDSGIDASLDHRRLNSEPPQTPNIVHNEMNRWQAFIQSTDFKTCLVIKNFPNHLTENISLSILSTHFSNFRHDIIGFPFIVRNHLVSNLSNSNSQHLQASSPIASSRIKSQSGNTTSSSAISSPYDSPHLTAAILKFKSPEIVVNILNHQNTFEKLIVSSVEYDLKFQVLNESFIDETYRLFRNHSLVNPVPNILTQSDQPGPSSSSLRHSANPHRHPNPLNHNPPYETDFNLRANSSSVNPSQYIFSSNQPSHHLHTQNPSSQNSNSRVIDNTNTVRVTANNTISPIPNENIFYSHQNSVNSHRSSTYSTYSPVPTTADSYDTHQQVHPADNLLNVHYQTDNSRLTSPNYLHIRSGSHQLSSISEPNPASFGRNPHHLIQNPNLNSTGTTSPPNDTTKIAKKYLKQINGNLKKKLLIKKLPSNLLDEAKIKNLKIFKNHNITHMLIMVEFNLVVITFADFWIPEMITNKSFQVLTEKISERHSIEIVRITDKNKIFEEVVPVVSVVSSLVNSVANPVSSKRADNQIPMSVSSRCMSRASSVHVSSAKPPKTLVLSCSRCNLKILANFRNLLILADSHILLNFNKINCNLNWSLKHLNNDLYYNSQQPIKLLFNSTFKNLNFTNQIMVCSCGNIWGDLYEIELDLLSHQSMTQSVPGMENSCSSQPGNSQNLNFENFYLKLNENMNHLYVDCGSNSRYGLRESLNS